jgi:hypothetical protein
MVNLIDDEEHAMAAELGKVQVRRGRDALVRSDITC